VNATNLPLGRATDYPQKYAPEVLCAIARRDSREALGIPGPLPFTGVDTWNAWELTWLGDSGKPQVATAQVVVPAESPNLVESKSLKLYLGSYAMTRFRTAERMRETIAADLSECVGAPVAVTLDPDVAIGTLPGTCIDTLDVECAEWEVDAGLLVANDAREVEECLHSHLLRSLCPVTGQPDIGSVLVSYRGPRIDPASLLRYIVSFREHHDFHEACVERMFVDILAQCRPTLLRVDARYQRRGGIDINPFRTNADDAPDKLRLWRQ
jgi:7-cyano-7-deazaguanine reductase